MTTTRLPLDRDWAACSACPFRLPGRAVCPALEPGGTVEPVACREAARGKRWRQRTRPCRKVAGRGRLRCRVGWRRLPLAVGHARNRPARSLHPGRGGGTKVPPRELLAARPRLSRSGSRLVETGRGDALVQASHTVATTLRARSGRWAAQPLAAAGPAPQPRPRPPAHRPAPPRPSRSATTRPRFAPGG
jgi:hypothetical protein